MSAATAELESVIVDAPPAREAATLPSILFVDDDVNILNGFRRQLRKKFQIHTAIGPLEGLEALERSGPFGVVVSDFQMPVMDGIQFLTRVRSYAPDTVRIMLTGQADFSTAMAAVNQGNIFRFLIKPCTTLVLEKVLHAGVEQHRLLQAERQLTEETLLGCVQVLVEVLSIVQPEAFSRATRVRRYVRQIAAALGLAGTWQWEVSAMLSQIGWITLPPDVLGKAAADEPMSEEERTLFLGHARAAARILGKIPRLDAVAQIVEKQHLPFRSLARAPVLDESDLVALGSQMLSAAIDFDSLRQGGLPHDDVLAQMRSESGVYMPEILDALSSIEKAEAADEIRMVPVAELEAGMIMDEELLSKNELILIGAGQEVTHAFVQRLANFSYGLARDHMCQVRVRRTGVHAASKPIEDQAVT